MKCGQIENKARAGGSSRSGVQRAWENEGEGAPGVCATSLPQSSNMASLPQPEFPPQDVQMDVQQQHPPPPGPQGQPPQEMMPPPGTPTPAPPSRKRKKNENGEPSSPAEPRRLRRSHEACARCRSKKIKVRFILLLWGGEERAGARPAIGPGLASPAGRHRRHFP